MVPKREKYKGGVDLSDSIPLVVDAIIFLLKPILKRTDTLSLKISRFKKI